MNCPNCNKEMIKTHYKEKFIDDNLELHTRYWCANCSKEFKRIDYYTCDFQDTEFIEVDKKINFFLCKMPIDK